MRLLEDTSKAWLRQRGLPVPEGAVAATANEAAAQAQLFGGPAALKALVPAGRRGKAGGVRVVGSREQALSEAGELLGKDIAGYTVRRLYVERAVRLERELYVSFVFDGLGPKVVVSTAGGVDIEAVFEQSPEKISSLAIDLRRGLQMWDAIGLWERAGLEPRLLPSIAQLTVQLSQAFHAADAVMLEINPLALDEEGRPWLVGAMMEIDDQALFRQPYFAERNAPLDSVGRTLNARERRMIEADRTFRGGSIRYTELDGDIGLFVAGGGAGLLQHDLIIAGGGRPANHSDVSPPFYPDKLAEIFGAIFDNPSARSLLIGFNLLQMAPCDTIIEGLLLAIESRNIDPRRFPIVVRLFGLREDKARALVASMPGIAYLPSGASLADGVEAVLAATRNAEAAAVVQ
jgi:succinyl-CoA synthetase beta subunit